MTGIIVLVYKSYEQVLRYVSQELSKVGCEHRVVIVDVGSPLASAERIATALGTAVTAIDAATVDRSSGLFVIHSPDNLGYARGNNLGVQFLLRHFPETDKLLFSNDDIELLTPDVVEQLGAKLDEMPAVGCIGPRVIDLNEHDQGPEYEATTVGRSILINALIPFVGAGFFSPPASAERPREAGEAYIVGGCFHMLRTADFLAASMFDARTFLYFEEEILSERLRRVGKAVYYYPAVRIRHFVGNTTSKHRSNLALVKTHLAGQWLYYREYRHVPWPALAALKLSAWLRLFLVYLADRKNALKRRANQR
ncbi:glycosyltransferase family 2 protein [Oligosphaera ethanolica]|uniref:GT2 family glycosyltransferase n=1 Tax=Oligosphaera ethanolica TaxID=760260 RepID=A0AAE3VG93_9BACT|nr:glycosyltransferase family 2 protein [Oligosphaera ethanolica]MDQ0289716.1 GT2 family glycosyltransferase [Oligosphaera ethanolica]